MHILTSTVSIHVGSEAQKTDRGYIPRLTAAACISRANRIFRILHPKAQISQFGIHDRVPLSWIQ
jgi:hypothetical protein